MKQTELRFKLLKYFNIFKDSEILYVTSCGLIFRQEDLEKVIQVEDINNIRMITRGEILERSTMVI